MRYQVQAGDSPARIAQRLTGNAARMGELLDANPAKPRMASAGMHTFASLHVGEQLNVPRAWAQFGVGAPVTQNGYTIDPTNANWNALLAAAQTMNQVSDFTQTAACGPVQAFQTAWNTAGGTPALTVDGNYGADTSYADSAVAQASGGGNVPAALTSGFPNCSGGGGGGGSGSYSQAVVAAATALNAQLVSQGCCGCGVAGSALSNATSAFKQAILTNASDWGSNTSAPTVTGSTINVSSQACQIAFGSEVGGTLSDLKAVLGASMTYAGSYCATSNCACVNAGTNCGSTPPPTPPACTAPQVPDSVTNQCVNPCSNGSAPANGVCPPSAPSTTTSSGTSAGALLAGVLLVGGGVAATTYAIKAKKKKHAA